MRGEKFKEREKVFKKLDLVEQARVLNEFFSFLARSNQKTRKRYIDLYNKLLSIFFEKALKSYENMKTGFKAPFEAYLSYLIWVSKFDSQKVKRFNKIKFENKRKYRKKILEIEFTYF